MRRLFASPRSRGRSGAQNPLLLRSIKRGPGTKGCATETRRSDWTGRTEAGPITATDNATEAGQERALALRGKRVLVGSCRPRRLRVQARAQTARAQS